jgi:hypothetical protein
VVAKVKSGGYWAIQRKYRTDKKRSLSWRELSTFIRCLCRSTLCANRPQRLDLDHLP